MGMASGMAGGGGGLRTYTASGGLSRSITEKLEDIVSVKDFGALGDDVDDTDALNVAFATGDVEIPPGDYRITDTVVIPAYARIKAHAGARITCAEGWQNLPAVTVGAWAKIEGLEVVEDNASPTNSDKDESGNIGISIIGKGVVLERCKTDGFGFGIVARNSGGDDTRDDFVLSRCVVTNAFSWGVEVDSAKNGRVVDCEVSYCGYDGVKVLNQYSRSSGGLILRGVHSHNNGRRDTAVGGSESTNGNGFDIYNGGMRIRLIECRGSYNCGAGINLKGLVGSPLQGECFVNGCQFDNNIYTSSGATAGIEIGDGGIPSHPWCKFVGTAAEDNQGDGVFIQGGFGLRFIGCNLVRNRRFGVNAPYGGDVSFIGCDIIANSEGNFVVGASNAGTFVSKRVVIDGCALSGPYSRTPLSQYNTSWDAAAEQKTSTFDSSTDTITSTTHGFVEGETVAFYTYTGTLPTGLSSDTTYWVCNVTADTFQLKTGPYAGSVVDFSTNGSGTIYATRDARFALRVYSDSADVSIVRTTAIKHWWGSGQMFLSGKRVLVERSTFIGGNRTEITTTVGDTTVRQSFFKDTIHTGSSTSGAIAAVSGRTEVERCDFSRSASASGYAVRFYATSTGGRFERNTQSNFSSLHEVFSGAVFDSDWQQVVRGTAAPTSGYHTLGAICWNSSPSAAGVPGWMNTGAGAPGTWKDMANLAA